MFDSFHKILKYCIFLGSIHWFLNYYLAPEGQTDIMLVLIGPKRGWEWYVNGQICYNYSEVLGNLLVRFILIMLPFTPFSSRFSPSFSKPRWFCIISCLSTYCFMASVFGTLFQFNIPWWSCVASSNGM